jgi:hypothetical protein
MRYSLYILFICFVFFSCKKNSPSDCTEDKYAYEFYSSSKIDTIITPVGIFFQINPGNEIVFSYTHTGPDCKSIADEEYVDRLVFKVPAGSNSFNYENRQLEDLMCLFMRSAFWSNGASLVSLGYVKGTKISASKWDIEINVELGSSIGRLILKKIFIPH